MDEPEVRLSSNERAELDRLFPFEYRGGGYFRKKGVPERVTAPILHGMQAVEFLFSRMKTENPSSVVQ